MLQESSYSHQTSRVFHSSCLWPKVVDRAGARQGACPPRKHQMKIHCNNDFLGMQLQQIYLQEIHKRPNQKAKLTLHLGATRFHNIHTVIHTPFCIAAKIITTTVISDACIYHICLQIHKRAPKLAQAKKQLLN